MELTTVYEQQGRMLRTIHRRAHCADVAGDAGGGFVVYHQHALNLVRGVSGKCRLNQVWCGGFTPRHFNHINAIAEVARGLNEEV